MAEPTSFTSFDTTTFPSQIWGNAQNPEIVFIGIHGFCGASQYFQGLAATLVSHSNKICIYAYNLRGMGYDPIESRKGDIEHADYWLRDLTALSKQLREKYPNSEFVYCGESLGALIALHTLSSKAYLCDRCILLSPVVNLNKHVPSLLNNLAHLFARAFPEYRISLDHLIGKKQVQVTQGSIDHYSQSLTNPWHLDSFTLRFLDSILQIIETAPLAFSQLSIPSLIIYGGKDFFIDPDSIENVLIQIPDSSKVQKAYYPNAHHLMLYDTQAPEIFQAISEWLEL
jgi:alpha-beta hydrolase superfamily lysophospholipase